MNTYLLDTDICSYIMKRSHPPVLDKLRALDIQSIYISVVTEAELLYGMQLSSKPKQMRAAFDAFIKHVRVLDWDHAAAEHYADIRASLHRSGNMIGANDLMIAAHSRSLDTILVTNNEREFRRVKGLKVENWST
jgi:tRNA(fMet)-specific endonuclease VapC